MVSAIYSYVSSGRLLRQQMVKRGDYIADNLAYNAKYGVLTEDKTLLTQLLEGTLAAGTSEGADVVGAMIRDAKGNVLAAHGSRVRDLPAHPPPTSEWRDALTDAGEEVLLFRSPVTTAETGGDAAAEAGLANAAVAAEQRQGGVEVAISKRELDSERSRILWLTVGLAVLLFTAGSVGGWYLTG